MKKTLISLALFGCATSTFAADAYNGRIGGMGGAGYVTADYSDGLVLNPSLAADYKKDDDFALVLNGGALGDDSDHLIDGLNDLVDYTDYLSSITDIQDLSQDNIDHLKNLMNAVDDKNAHANFGGSLVAAIPNAVIPMALVAKVSGQVSLTTLVDENDYTLIDNSLNNPFNPEDLQSSAIGTGAAVGEVGLALAKRIAYDDSRALLIGLTPKRLEVKTIVYNAQVSTFDENDLDADNYTLTSHASNLDAGVTYIDGNMRYGLTATNLSDKKFKTVLGGEFELKRKITAAVGYTNDWAKLEVALDLNSTPAFGLGGDTKMLRAGVEVSPLSWLQLRAGLMQDQEGTEADAYSFGLGLSPFDTVNLDIAYFTGDKDTKGAALQLGVRL